MADQTTNGLSWCLICTSVDFACNTRLDKLRRQIMPIKGQASSPPYNAHFLFYGLAVRVQRVKVGTCQRTHQGHALQGSKRSGSSFHKDPNSTSAWNAVIKGSKKWILYPPNVTPPGGLFCLQSNFLQEREARERYELCNATTASSVTKSLADIL